MNALDGLCRVRNVEFTRLSGSVLMLQEFLFRETDAVSVNALGWHLGEMVVMKVGWDRVETSGRRTPSVNLNWNLSASAFKMAFQTFTCVVWKCENFSACDLIFLMTWKSTIKVASTASLSTRGLLHSIMKFSPSFVTHSRTRLEFVFAKKRASAWRAWN